MGPPATPRRVATAAWLTLWLAGVVAGTGLLWKYKQTPGPTGRAPSQWPSDTAVTRAARPTLVMTLHPGCACSVASVAELAKLMRALEGRVDTHVLVVQLAGPGVKPSGAVEAARRIPGVDVRTDPGGVEAARFGAKTSGTVVLYDEHGALAFEGGLTTARGHEGDSPGAAQISALVLRDTPSRTSTVVYGCELEDPPADPLESP